MDENKQAGVTSEDFDAGFELGNQPQAEPQQDELAEVQDEAIKAEPAVLQEQAAPQAEQAAAVPPVQPPVAPVQPPLTQPAAMPQPQAVYAEPPAQVDMQELSDDVREELDRLKELNPAAASLALEDTPEGESIRKRLASLGAEAAQDRAEMIMYRREENRQIMQERTAQVDAYNRNFRDTVQRTAPDFFAMVNDPERKAEAAQYMSSMESWIKAKPYGEAVAMMEAYVRGNAEQVCELLSRYEKEKAKPADASAVLAVPSRGGFLAPASAGDKYDFDAGWEMNR